MANPRFSPKTLEFLALAAKQKNAAWLDKHQQQYEDAILAPMKALAHTVTSVLELEFPAYKFKKRNIGNLKRPAARALDKGPLKDFLTLTADRDSGSRFEDLPSLYFMVSPRPDEIFSAGGLYMASASQVKRIRQWIDAKPQELEVLLKDKGFKKLFGELGDEHKLKTKPRDYPVDHPRIDWLKLTAYYVWRPLPKKELYSSELAHLLIRDWREAMRLNNLLDQWLKSAPESTMAVVPSPAGRPHGLPAFDWDDDV